MGVICLPANHHVLSESHLAAWGLDTASTSDWLVMWWTDGNWHAPTGGRACRAFLEGRALRSPVVPEMWLAQFGFALVCCSDLAGLTRLAKDTSLGIFVLYVGLVFFMRSLISRRAASLVYLYMTHWCWMYDRQHAYP